MTSLIYHIFLMNKHFHFQLSSSLTHSICPSILTGLHVEQQVLAVLLSLLNVLLQLSSLGRREQRALFAVFKEVGHLGLHVIQHVLPL